MSRIYLDHNASSPLRESVRVRLSSTVGGVEGNPSSAHTEGRAARRQLEHARESLARLAGCAAEELCFTSGGTESNAWAIGCAARGAPLAVADTEHASVLAAARRRTLTRALAVDRDGRILPPQDGSVWDFASIATANHETGCVQDIARLATHCSVLHTDASQALGRIPFDFRASAAQLATLSAHKLGGPVGIGALLVRAGCELEPFLGGGPQERGRRAGTESAALAELFAVAAEEACALQAEETGRQRRWIEQLRQGIQDLDESAIFLSPSVDCLPNTLCVAFPGRPGPSLVHRLDLEGVSVSFGSACASGSLEPSPVVLAMGYPPHVAASAIRISFGHTNREGDVEQLLDTLARVLAGVRRRGAEKMFGADSLD